MTTPAMTPQRANALYALRCKLARAKHPQASREYAEAMSSACREYEENMRRAAATGDAGAAKALRDSEGPYLNP